MHSQFNKIYIHTYIHTRLVPSSLLEERSKTPIVFAVSFVLSATPQTGGNSQSIQIDIPTHHVPMVRTRGQPLKIFHIRDKSGNQLTPG